jgi:hypothetical protein
MDGWENTTTWIEMADTDARALAMGIGVAVSRKAANMALPSKQPFQGCLAYLSCPVLKNLRVPLVQWFA